MATQTKPQRDTELHGSLEAQGLAPSGDVHWNLVAPVLIEHAIRRGEGELADMGPFVSTTAPHTGRSPNDKFVVKEPSTAFNPSLPQAIIDAALARDPEAAAAEWLSEWRSDLSAQRFPGGLVLRFRDGLGRAAGCSRSVGSSVAVSRMSGGANCATRPMTMSPPVPKAQAMPTSAWSRR